MAGTITLTGAVTGGPSGAETFTVSIVVPGTIINDQLPLTLLNPTTVVTIPTGATVMYFTPPPTNQLAILIGSYQCHRTLPTILCFDASQATITFSIAAVLTGCELRWF